MKINPIFTSSIDQNKAVEKAAKKQGRKAALTSAIIPGLSQFKDGRTGAGLGFLSSMLVGWGVLISKVNSKMKILKNTPIDSTNKNLKSFILTAVEKTNFTKTDAIITAATAGALLIIGTANIVDAYKHGKKSNTPTT